MVQCDLHRIRPQARRAGRNLCAGLRRTAASEQQQLPDLAQQASLFYGGKIYGNLGAFIQTTYANDYGRVFGLDNADIRYASTGAIGNLDFVYGVTVNDIPTVQDVWNTTPVWRFPFITSNFALSPAASTMLEASARARPPARAAISSLTTSSTPNSPATAR